ncbi:MAG: helix-turn-helix transcriptional regulator [Halobacteriovoraceae bacterium]|nr:helix-turn-helix transcriptional regulator [Halobacteriovoraceae bacterium]
MTNNLHVLRAEKRLTQQGLADAIGVTRLTVNSMEKGNYNPSLELAFRLSIYFEKDIKDIFTVESKDE